MVSGTFSSIDVAHVHSSKSGCDSIHSVLYVKDKLSVSIEAFYELCMVSNLPSSSKIKSITRKLNYIFTIRSTPKGCGRGSTKLT